MKILSVGYPRTGTRTLWKALRTLGFNALHHDDERVPLFPAIDQNFRLYDDVDAATEEIYWREVAGAYPDAKIILTVRDVDAWWASVQFVVNQNRCLLDPWKIDRYDHIQRLLYGSASPVEYLYKKRFVEHSQQVHERLSRRLLVLRMTQDDCWKPLCEFLGVAIPNEPWPWENRR